MEKIIDGRSYSDAPPVVAWTCDGCDLCLDRGGRPCDLGDAHCDGENILLRALANSTGGEA